METASLQFDDLRISYDRVWQGCEDHDGPVCPRSAGTFPRWPTKKYFRSVSKAVEGIQKQLHWTHFKRICKKRNIQLVVNRGLATEFYGLELSPRSRR